MYLYNLSGRYIGCFRSLDAIHNYLALTTGEFFSRHSGVVCVHQVSRDEDGCYRIVSVTVSESFARKHGIIH